MRPPVETLLRVLVYRGILLSADSGGLRDGAAHTCVGGCRPRSFISDDASHDWDGNDSGHSRASTPFPIVRIIRVRDAVTVLVRHGLIPSWTYPPQTSG